MPIKKAYEPDGKPILSPSDICSPLSCPCVTVVVTFSADALAKVLSTEECEPFFTFRATCNGESTLYYLRKRNVFVFLSPIGSGVAGGLLQLLAHLTGAKRFVYFGSCGVLDPSYADHYIVPTSVYREDGFSYHYAPPSDYIDIKNCDKVAEFLHSQGIEPLIGKGWTTDAVYNETQAKCQARRSEGVLCVDMEASGLQAVSNHLGVELYIFFFAGDILGKTWDRSNLGGENERKRQADSSVLALTLASLLENGN